MNNLTWNDVTLEIQKSNIYNNFRTLVNNKLVQLVFCVKVVADISLDSFDNYVS